MKKDYSDVLSKIKIALYVLIALFAVNIVLNTLTTTNTWKLRNNVVSTSGGNSEDEEEANPLLETNQVLNEKEMVENVPEITYAEYKELMEKDTVTVVMLGYDDCYWCVQEKEILRDYLYDKEVNVKYLNIKKISEDEFNELSGSHESLASFGTPTFVALKNGISKVDINGARGTTALTTMFEEMGAL